MIETLKAYAVNPTNIKAVVAQIFNHCGIHNCDKHSLGFVCSGCSIFVCNRHCYWQVSLSGKPVPLCAACVVDSHPELFVPESEEGASE